MRWLTAKNSYKSFIIVIYGLMAMLTLWELLFNYTQKGVTTYNDDAKPVATSALIASAIYAICYVFSNYFASCEQEENKQAVAPGEGAAATLLESEDEESEETSEDAPLESMWHAVPQHIIPFTIYYAWCMIQLFHQIYAVVSDDYMGSETSDAATSVCITIVVTALVLGSLMAGYEYRHHIQAPLERQEKTNRSINYVMRTAMIGFTLAETLSQYVNFLSPGSLSPRVGGGIALASMLSITALINACASPCTNSLRHALLSPVSETLYLPWVLTMLVSMFATATGNRLDDSTVLYIKAGLMLAVAGVATWNHCTESDTEEESHSASPAKHS